MAGPTMHGVIGSVIGAAIVLSVIILARKGFAIWYNSYMTLPKHPRYEE